MPPLKALYQTCNARIHGGTSGVVLATNFRSWPVFSRVHSTAGEKTAAGRFSAPHCYLRPTP